MSDFSIPPQQRDFHCSHCGGRIVIPFDLPPTIGPCPHCQAEITSPPPPELKFSPTAPAPALEPRPQPKAPPEPQAPAQPPTALETTSSPSVLPPRRDGAGVPEAKDNPVRKGKAKKKSSSGIISAMLGLFLLILAGGAAAFYLSNQMGTEVTPPKVAGNPQDQEIRETNYIRIGWQKDAYEVLDKFLAGTSVEQKLPHVNNAAGVRPRMESFYGGVTINDSDTPTESFSVHGLPEADRRRGIFMLIYDQPPQFALRDFFRPLASLEVQYGIDEADILLSTMARVGNFAMEPVRVHAFFKRTGEGLKLDWEVFAQTKYRIFRNFIELPDPGQTEILRVLIQEDVPDKGQGVTGTRTYRISDPANPSDSARINVTLDSDLGRTLSVINWRGTKQNQPITNTATIELEWAGEPDAPVLQIKRFVCWEFLGLGGTETPVTAATK